ncbi:bifunctional DNA primase/polymerase [Streptomyces sp. NPDC051561]|uniref:bifunctional DNA primase/polymerase n=1 Tax=Streptomyces sp. NPDC051561 TaxID=3365658 RepID=UPI0037904497
MAAADRGWHVFPLRPDAKVPALHGEARCPGTGDCTAGHLKWEQRATTDPDRIRAAWARAPFNVAIATGPSGLVVVDLDVSKEEGLEGAPDGATSLAALCERAGEPYPVTYTVRTASGGHHLYFTAPDGVRLTNSAGKLGKSVDTRAYGGYVVGADSIVDGRPYEVEHPLPPVLLPGWLQDLCSTGPLPAQRPARVRLHTGTRMSRYLAAAVKGELDRVARSAPGGRNIALYRAAVALGQLVAGGQLSEDDVTRWLTEEGAHVGQGPRETLATVSSGMRAGAARPRTLAR